MREYDVTINGVATRLQLSDEDAERAGVPRTSSGRVSNKARTTEPGLSDTGSQAVGGGASSTRSAGRGKRVRTKETSDDTAEHGDES